MVHMASDILQLASTTGVSPQNAQMLIGLSNLDSSVVAEFVYNVSSHQLEVTFASTGETYLYYNVPFLVVLGLWHEVLAGRSAGSYFNKEIRNRFPFQIL